MQLNKIVTIIFISLLASVAAVIFLMQHNILRERGGSSVVKQLGKDLLKKKQDDHFSSSSKSDKLQEKKKKNEKDNIDDEDEVSEKNNNNNNDDNNNNNKLFSSLLPSSIQTFPKNPHKIFDYVSSQHKESEKKNDGNIVLQIQDEKGGKYRDIHCETIRTSQPRSFTCQHFLTKEESEYLISLGEPNLEKSGVVSAGKKQKYRTSSGSRLPSADPVVAKVSRRILSLVNFTSGQGKFAERLYLLNYKEGQYYFSHPDDSGGVGSPYAVQARRKRYSNWISKNEKKILKKLKKIEGKNHNHHHMKKNHHHHLEKDDEEEEISFLKKDLEKLEEFKKIDGKHVFDIPDQKPYSILDRAVTVLMYLRTIPAGLGGNTSFPLLDAQGNHFESDEQIHKLKQEYFAEHKTQEKNNNNKNNNNNKFYSCDGSKFYNVRPIEGQVLVFYSLDEYGNSDKFATHQGCPPLDQEHEKWTITKWLQVPLP